MNSIFNLKDKVFDEFDKLAKEMLRYIEEKEVDIAGEWGSGETLEELIDRNMMPDLWHKLKKED
mgnify:CR=1 FL=1